VKKTRNCAALLTDKGSQRRRIPVKHHSALILIGFLALGAASGCGAHDGAPDVTGGGDGTVIDTGDSARSETLAPDPKSYRRKTSRGTRGYQRSTDYEGRSVDSCCDVETELDRTVYVSPRGSDGAPGTQDAPVLTLARAIRLAAERGYSVYVAP
jgi:hypothetical protein